MDAFRLAALWAVFDPPVAALLVEGGGGFCSMVALVDDCVLSLAFN